MTVLQVNPGVLGTTPKSFRDRVRELEGHKFSIPLAVPNLGINFNPLCCVDGFRSPAPNALIPDQPNVDYSHMTTFLQHDGHFGSIGRLCSLAFL